MRSLIMAASAIVAAWQFGGVGMIQAKAWLAPILIERAWQQTLETGKPVRPWPWADTGPVAKLTVASLGIEQYVLAGANGASLPFGPGHVTGSAEPGGTGTIILAAHRDTHFRFLDQLGPGDEIRLENAGRRVQLFTVSSHTIVDARTQSIQPVTTGSELILVTCEPTNAFSYQGPYRLVVTAQAMGGQPRTH